MNKTTRNQNLRTSLTHPLQIDWISLREENGRIGVTLCPGKYQPISWTGGWNRDLELDIQTLVKSEVNCVISLIDENEMEVLRVEHLGTSLQDNGIHWIHLPLEDTTAPDKMWIGNFQQQYESISKDLSSDKRILIHCKGGLGRAGTCAALILFLQGYEMNDAIHLIRTTRSSDCINPLQQTFLEKFSIGYKTHGFTKTTKIEEKVRA